MHQKHHILCARTARGHFTLVLHFIFCPSACCLLQTYNDGFNCALIYVPLRVQGQQSMFIVLLLVCFFFQRFRRVFHSCLSVSMIKHNAGWGCREAPVILKVWRHCFCLCWPTKHVYKENHVCISDWVDHTDGKQLWKSSGEKIFGFFLLDQEVTKTTV